MFMKRYQNISAATAMLRMGLSFVRSITSGSNVTPISFAVRDSSSPGAETYATVTETAMRIAAITRFCQRKIVCVSGITPVIGSSAAGIDDFVACSSAADDESPSAHTLPRPRYAAAPRAR